MEKILQKKLLLLARAVLERELLKVDIDLQQYHDPAFDMSKGIFVTLTLDGKLRGCIGKIEPDRNLWQSVIYLSKAAAFDDPRFSSLQAEELKKTLIEISVLSIPVELKGATGEEKARQIRPGVDGVILSSSNQSATYLPQVWETLPDKEVFLEDLCKKARLPEDYWRSNKVSISTYQVEHFDENL